MKWFKWKNIFLLKYVIMKELIIDGICLNWPDKKDNIKYREDYITYKYIVTIFDSTKVQMKFAVVNDCYIFPFILFFKLVNNSTKWFWQSKLNPVIWQALAQTWFSSLRHRWSWAILAFLFKSFDFIALKLF